MVKFNYNNAKNANKDYISFKLNYGYYFSISYKKNNNLCFQVKFAHKLPAKLENLITMGRKNL